MYRVKTVRTIADLSDKVKDTCIIIYPLSDQRKKPGEGNGNLLQYSCLGNPKDRGAWQATGQGCKRVGHDLMTKQQEES